MKSKIRPSKQMTERVEEMMYDYTLRACETNNAFFLIALNQEFNFGAVRLRKLILRYNEISQMYRDHIRDGFTDAEVHEIIRNAIIDIGLEPSQVFTDVGQGNFKKIKQEKKRYQKNNIPSPAEAEEAVNQLKAFRAAIKEQKSS